MVWYGMEWYIYILRCSDDTLYTGATNNLAKRILTHQKGKGAKYTKSRLPIVVLYSECCANKSEALQRERQIKKMTRQEKLKLIGLKC